MSWKEELSAIVEARTYGQLAATLPRLLDLDRRQPNVAEINHQLGWTHEMLGQPADARPRYERALALGLPPNEHSGALIGLAAVCRSLGEPARAAEVLHAGRLLFPGNREFDAFLALAHHDAQRHAEAVRLLVDLLCDTSEDPGIAAYQRALRHAAAALR